MSFSELDAATDAMAAGLMDRGIDHGPVASILLNEPVTIILYLALARIGAVSVPVNSRLVLDEQAYIIGNSGSSILIFDQRFASQADELRGRVPTLRDALTVNGTDSTSEKAGQLEDLIVRTADRAFDSSQIDARSVATIIYTSGTTGFPKGVVRTHEANLWACVNSALGQPRSPQDVEVFALPLFGIGFMLQVMPILMAGGSLVLDQTFDPVRTWELLEQHRATRVFLAPTMLDSMLRVADNEQYDVSALAVINTAYEFPERIRTRALDRFGDIFVYMYGLTEAQLCCSQGPFSRDPSSAGHPMGLMRLNIVDGDRRPVPVGTPGEIALEGPSLMAGYLNLEHATAAALAEGWLYTGDVGYLDEERNLHFTGRNKEMIKTGGYSVDPVEVENAILGLDGVREAAVIGVKDEHWGEAVVAFVVRAVGIEVNEIVLRAHLESHLSDFKRPKQIFFIAELPKNPTGKIERARLRTLAGHLLALPSNDVDS